MPLPLILGVGAAVAGLVGVGSGVHGAVKSFIFINSSKYFRILFM